MSSDDNDRNEEGGDKPNLSATKTDDDKPKVLHIDINKVSSLHFSVLKVKEFLIVRSICCGPEKFFQY